MYYNNMTQNSNIKYTVNNSTAMINNVSVKKLALVKMLHTKCMHMIS